MFRKRHTGAVLVVDIDDMSVGAAIVHLGTHAAVAHAMRTRLPLEERSRGHSVSAITQLLETTAQKAVETYAADPMAVPLMASYAIVRSPWTRFRTAQAEEAYEHGTVITDALIVSLVKKALRNPSDLDAGNRLESGVVHVYLNGYPTNRPTGKRAFQAMVTAYESDINPDVRRSVTDVLLKVLPGRTPIIRSSMCALLAVSSEHLPETHRAVIVDVGSSSTYCAVVLKEAVTETALVAEGLSTVLNRIASGTLPENILSQLRMLANDTCATDACKALKDALARSEPDLAKSFGEAFAKLASRRRLPNTMTLSAPAEIAPWLASFFGRIDFAQFTTTLQPLSVELLTTDHLSHVLSWDNTAPDTALGVAAVYVHILGASA